MQGRLTLLNVFRGVKVKMKRTETALLLLLMMDGLYGGSHSAELHGEKKGLDLKLHITFFLFFLTLSGRRCFNAAFLEGKLDFFFFVCECVCVSSRLLFLILEKKKNVRLKSITDALFNSTMPFYFTLGWVGGWVGEG